jgi:hypothetical protein
LFYSFPEANFMASAAVDTKKVEGRRKLHFETIEDIGADVEQLARGPVRNLGNWTPGQVFKHLALAMTYSIDGFPTRAPFPLRIVGKLVKKRVLIKGMSPGFQLKKDTARDLVPGPTDWQEGLAAIRTAMKRLQTETKRKPHGFFGSMTKDEYEQLHCRHSELHLSFLISA